jgi:hypothetical protein
MQISEGIMEKDGITNLVIGTWEDIEKIESNVD